MRIILGGVLPRYGVRAVADKLRRSILPALFTLAAAVSVAPAAAEPVRIAMLGDSLTQGYGLVAAEGIVPQLQAWLAARGHDVVMINAGVSGDTTAGGLSRLDWTLADDPDAMIVALGGNDLLRGIDPAASRANLAAILARLAEAEVPVLLAGMPAPGNFGPEFREAFAAMYPALAEEFGALLHPDLLGPITARLMAGQGIDDLMQADRIHPNAAGVRALVEALGPAVEALLARVGAGS